MCAERFIRIKTSRPGEQLLGLLGLLLLTGCATPHGPVGFWSRNRYDRSGDQRHGPWRTYFDAKEDHLATAGRYRHGRAVGRWRLYNPTGALERTERYHRRPHGLVTLGYYHPTGQLAKQGRARYLVGSTTVRFFWFGEWKCYAPDGRPLPSEWYQDGKKMGVPVAAPTPR